MQRLKAVQTAVVEGNWNLAQHLEFIPTTGSNAVTQAELRAAQRTHLDHMRLQQVAAKGPSGHRRLTAGHSPEQVPQLCRQSKGVAKVTGGRLDADRPPLPVPTHQTGLLQRFERQLTRTCRGALQQERKLAESSPVRGRSMLLGRWRFAVLTQKHRLDKRVSFRKKSEERKTPQRRSPCRDRKKSQ